MAKRARRSCLCTFGFEEDCKKKTLNLLHLPTELLAEIHSYLTNLSDLLAFADTCTFFKSVVFNYTDCFEVQTCRYSLARWPDATKGIQPVFKHLELLVVHSGIAKLKSFQRLVLKDYSCSSLKLDCLEMKMDLRFLQSFLKRSRTLKRLFLTINDGIISRLDLVLLAKLEELHIHCSNSLAHTTALRHLSALSNVATLHTRYTSSNEPDKEQEIFGQFLQSNNNSLQFLEFQPSSEASVNELLEIMQSCASLIPNSLPIHLKLTFGTEIKIPAGLPVWFLTIVFVSANSNSSANIVQLRRTVGSRLSRLRRLVIKSLRISVEMLSDYKNFLNELASFQRSVSFKIDLDSCEFHDSNGTNFKLSIPSENFDATAPVFDLFDLSLPRMERYLRLLEIYSFRKVSLKFLKNSSTSKLNLNAFVEHSGAYIELMELDGSKCGQFLSKLNEAFMATGLNINHQLRIRLTEFVDDLPVGFGWSGLLPYLEHCYFDVSHLGVIDGSRLTSLTRITIRDSSEIDADSLMKFTENLRTILLDRYQFIERLSFNLNKLGVILAFNNVLKDARICGFAPSGRFSICQTGSFLSSDGSK